MIARLLAVAAALAVVLACAPAADALAAKKPSKRVSACKTKKASKKAAKQPKRKRRCRPQAKHLRKSATAPRPAAATPSAPAPLAQPGDPTAAPIAGDPATDPAPAADPTCGPSHNLGATAEDADGFRLRLTRTCVPAGALTVNFRNTDSSDHDLWAMPLGAAPGSAQQVIERTPTTEDMPLFGTATVTAGRWELFCSLNGHGAMKAAITVTP